MAKNDGSGTASTTSNMDIDDLTSRFSRTMAGTHRASMPHSFNVTGRSKNNAPVSTPAVSTRSRSRTLPKTPPMRAGEESLFIKKIEADGDLARAIGYHVYNSTDEDVGIQVREEVVTHVKQNFDYYLSKFDVQDSDKLLHLLRRWKSPERQKGDDEFITAAATAYNTQFTVFGFNEKVATPVYFCSEADDRKPAYGMNGIFYMRELDMYMPVIVNTSPSIVEVDSQSSSSTSSKSGGTRTLLSRLSHQSLRNIDIPQEVETNNKTSPGHGLKTPQTSESFLSRAFGSFRSGGSHTSPTNTATEGARTSTHTPPTDTATDGARTSVKFTMSPILEGVDVETVNTPEENEFDHQQSGHDYCTDWSSEMKRAGWNSTESRASRKSIENRKHRSSGSTESSKNTLSVRPLFALEDDTADTESGRRASKRLMAKAKKSYKK